MASVVDICNKALSLLGQEAIVSLDDTTPQGNACRTHWPLLRDKILRGHKWNCATKRAALNRLVQTPAFEFGYYYQLPSDYLMIVEVVPAQEFEVESGLLLCNSDSCSIKYIRAEDDSTKYDAQLVSAFSYLLAAEMAYLTTSSTSLAVEFRKIGTDELADAKATDSFEAKRRDNRGSKFARSRLG